MSCPCQCPDCGRNIHQFGTIAGVTPHGKTIKQCPCGRRRIGMTWEVVGDPARNDSRSKLALQERLSVSGDEDV